MHRVYPPRVILSLAGYVAEKALATLQSRPITTLHPAVSFSLSPYPSTTPPTPLPPPSASPRFVKQLPPGFTDSQLYDLFRPYGALASVRTPTPAGEDTGLVEFWREEDARDAEEALHCAEVEGQNISVQLYQPRRTAAVRTEFSPNAPTFVPTGAFPTQVCGKSICHFICQVLSVKIVFSPSRIPLWHKKPTAVCPWSWAASSVRATFRSRIHQP